MHGSHEGRQTKCDEGLPGKRFHIKGDVAYSDQDAVWRCEAANES